LKNLISNSKMKAVWPIMMAGRIFFLKSAENNEVKNLVFSRILSTRNFSTRAKEYRDDGKSKGSERNYCEVVARAISKRDISIIDELEDHAQYFNHTYIRTLKSVLGILLGNLTEELSNSKDLDPELFLRIIKE
ncbi:MAG: hypothetical protein MHPSP_000856, partial [Paramarteilia canceri]